MKKVLTILAAILSTATLWAQSPEKMTYQAVIRDADGNLVTNTKIGVRVRIQKFYYGMPPTYKDEYIETHSAYSTNENGLLTLPIGTGDIVQGTFADIDWSDGIYYLKTEIDPNGGTNYTITAKSQFMSVPYALYAKNVKTYKVGDFAQGGIVFWVDETGQHGLVCAKSDQDGGSGIRWNAGTSGVTRATGRGLYAGETNTAIIIAAQIAIGDDGNDYAAQICNDLQITEDGITYGDWYLPSIIELVLMYQNKAKIDATATANGGVAIAESFYWSSVEFSNSLARNFTFDQGTWSYNTKYNTYKVRAVRAF